MNYQTSCSKLNWLMDNGHADEAYAHVKTCPVCLEVAKEMQANRLPKGIWLRDELMKFIANEPDSEAKRMLSEAQLFNIQNVADYFWQSDQIYWDLNVDFPNIAPPFSNMWLEYAMPDKAKLEDGERSLITTGERVGIWMTSEYGEAPARWNVVFMLFMHPAGEPMGSWQLQVDEVGKLMPDTLKGRYDRVDVERYGHEHLQELITFCHAAFLAISFLHCRNVETVERGGPKPKGVRSRHNRTEPRHHVIVIEPIRRILRDEGGSEKVGLAQALKICRGHFKHYEEGSGLFGKLHGTYWWGERLKASGGVEYKVKSPRK